MKPTCETCTAFYPVSPGAEAGTCRANPPAAIPIPTQNVVTGKVEVRLQSGWPPTSAKEGCRAHQLPTATNHAALSNNLANKSQNAQ